MSYSGIKVLDNGMLHAVRYIFEEGLSIKELEEEGIVRLKSGISSNTLKGYKTETIRTDSTGKKFLLWDDSFIDQNLTLDIAAEIISLMDKSFKQIMVNEGFHSRSLHNDRTIGTEFYESDDRDSLIEIIERNWDRAYRIAYEFVTKTELSGGIEVLPFEPRPNQDTLFINPLVEYFKTGDKATAQSHGGTGKTKMSFRTSEIVCKEILNTTWKTLMFSDNIANTVQLTAEFAKFYKGQTGKRIMDIYLIGSASPKDYKLLEAWANVFPVSNTEKVVKALQDSHTSKRPSAFFVVNKSAEKFLKLAEKAGVDFKNWFTALDEIQQYANETDQPKVVTSSECAVVNPRFENLFGKKLGLSATHIVRDPELCNDPSAVFNDDEDKFGPRIVDIDEITARSLGWISEKQGVIIPLPATPEFLQSVEEKRPLQVTIEDESITIHPQYFVAVEGLVKYILPQNKTHILLLSTYIKDIQLLANLFRILQEKGKIDSDYEIIEGYSKCGNSCVNQFNKAKKAIMIATRWIGVGQDTYKCDCTFPLYNPSSKSFARQFSMRGDRVYEDKVSLLAFVAIETNLQDSIWYEALENISNGEIPNIVSESEFRQLVDREVVGSNRNPNDGSNVGNITVVRSTNNDPIVFEKWETLSNHISAWSYTDSHGNSRFSDIVSFLIKYTLEECEKITSTYNTLFSFRQNNTYLTGVIRENKWQSNCYSHMLDYEREINRDNKEYIIQELKKYKGHTIMELTEMDGPTKGSRRYGPYFLLCCARKLGLNPGEIINPKFKWTKQEIFKLAKSGEYKNRTEMVANIDKLYTIHLTPYSKELDLIFGINNTINVKDRLEKLKKYKTFTEWRKAEKKDYQFLKSHGYEDTYKKHFKDWKPAIRMVKETTTGTIGTYNELASYFTKLTGQTISRDIIYRRCSGLGTENESCPLHKYKFTEINS